MIYMYRFCSLTAILAVCLLPARAGEEIVYGESSDLGDGTVTSYARLDADGNVEAYGFKMTASALDGLSSDPGSERHTHVHMPEGLDATPVEYIDIHFLPGGHPGGPGNNYWLVPHFDFHFFLNDVKAAATYVDAGLAFNPLPAAYIPEGYILAPDSFVPGEGVHWVNPAEFGGPYTTNFIYGSYDGEMTFIEPMEALSFLEDMRDGNVDDFSGAIGAAAYNQVEGLYPAAYSISYDADEGAFRVEMSSLSMGSAAPYQLPGDCNQDGQVDLADAVCLIDFLFRGSPTALPCDDGGVTNPATIQRFDWDASGGLDLSDVIGLLGWRWLEGPPHPLGSDCALIPGCPDTCSP